MQSALTKHACPEIKSCCFGCNLESGSITIGWLYLVGSILVAVGCVINIINPDLSYHDGNDTSTVTCIVLLTVAIFNLMMSILLIISVNRRSLKYIQFWILVTTGSVVLYVFATFVRGIVIAVNGYVLGAVAHILVALISPLIMAISVVIVFNFKREILSENQHV